MNSQKTAIIIGAGPAGLTAAFELLLKTDIKPIVIEKSEYMGGISRTINYKGNRIDIGGHRFFSKSDRVMDWWLNILPIEALAEAEQPISYQNKSRTVATSTQGPNPELESSVMLVRGRKSRIYFLRKFFDYPITLSTDTLSKLGLARTIRIGFSYLKSVLFPIKDEATLEHFFINRFGKELYLTFFKSYTEKVWGQPCNQISAEWGAQRIKGLSIWKTVTHFFKKIFSGKSKTKGDIAQKGVETSLIEQFLYPKYGPGQMWEEVARIIKEKGGEIITGLDVVKLYVDGDRIKEVEAVDRDSREKKIFRGDYFFSTMPMKELVRSMEIKVPPEISEISEGLIYRDFITVGLLLNKLKIKDDERGRKLISDNWIYIQEPDVLVGRMQIFNNWSPYMLADASKVWIGLEYFCYETDDIWKMSEQQMTQLAIEEIDKIGILEKTDVLDSTVIHVPKTYPAYFGTYDRFDELREYLDQFENLFLVGRNGMHRYNNQDHSMLTAMVAVENIIEGRTDKANLWTVNTEKEYHETKK